MRLLIRLFSIALVACFLSSCSNDSSVDTELIQSTNPAPISQQSADPIPTSKQAKLSIRSDQYRLIGSLPQVNVPYVAQSGVYKHEPL